MMSSSSSEGSSPAAAEISKSCDSCKCNIPKPPRLPSKLVCSSSYAPRRHSGYSYVHKEVKDVWDKIFEEGYRADVHIITENHSLIPAHSNVLGIASPVLRNIIGQTNAHMGVQIIKIMGVPADAVRSFVHFLYSSCYKHDDMKNFALHLLVLSHTYCIPSLKRVCIRSLEQALLTAENVIDVLQLARQCDAPRLSLICIRLILSNFKLVYATEGWKVMKQVDPSLEQELLEAVVNADSRKQDRLKKAKKEKIYQQLYEAMEALVHICRDGCKNIGHCRFPACKGLETLVRHFSSCKTGIPGGCAHCKRMWQILELHSRMCKNPDFCKVSLCSHLKAKMQTQTKKEAAKWEQLISKVKSGKRQWLTGNLEE